MEAYDGPTVDHDEGGWREGGKYLEFGRVQVRNQILDVENIGVGGHIESIFGVRPRINHLEFFSAMQLDA